MALLAGLIVAGRWFVTADPKTLAKALKWVAGAVVVAIIVSLAATGRLGWAIMALPALLPWLARARAVHRAARNFSRMSAGMMGGGGTGRTSEVRTRFLKMVLDHDSGIMNGEVIDGTHSGRRLDDLSLAELLDLLNACHLQDAQSAQVLETYLDRVHPDWRERVQAAGAGAGTGGGPGTPVPGGMSREEAYQVLGLEPGASDDDIKAAHHRLIANLHPDRGGSTYLAAKINQAKDVLLGE
ncbi:DnaJ domain-containing protein [Shumkonia mesophila]|uniref:DnaJ domain-containing protein n=1 Tax=Shumkonia mesophila TaxID=2838854 RepID=UPI002934EA7A|nr:DnaJ domain-containing protein [Shumkonia mesophila]